MSRTLTPSIARYLAAVNAFDADAATASFAPDATVHDEGRDHVGASAIRAWQADTIARYATHTVVEDVSHADDATVVTGLVSGTFPGSPLRLRFAFGLHGDRIVRLEIGA